MLNVEQFVYTTTSIEERKGYQIVAKSERITERTISELEQYVYPLGIDPSEFKESRSFVLLRDNLIAYSRIKNIGLGYDGRDNTLYNHTFVFSKNDFEKYGNDSRIFDKFYLEDKSIQGILPTLSIDPPTLPFSPVVDELKPWLSETISSLFMNQKIALLSDDIELPQKILSFLPKSMRLIPFSTYVVEPKKQPKYRFISGSKLNKSNLEEDFKIISPTGVPNVHNKTSFEKSILYYVELICSNKYDELKEIQESFEKIPGTDFKNKLIFLTTFSKYKTETDENLKEKYAEEIVGVLKKLDKSVASEYLAKIKPHLKQYAVLEDKLQSVINPSTSLLDAFFLLPLKVMNDLYNSYLEQHEKSENDKEDE